MVLRAGGRCGGGCRCPEAIRAAPELSFTLYQDPSGMPTQTTQLTILAVGLAEASILCKCSFRKASLDSFIIELILNRCTY